MTGYHNAQDKLIYLLIFSRGTQTFKLFLYRDFRWITNRQVPLLAWVMAKPNYLQETHDQW
jgi:hypothetical protein